MDRSDQTKLLEQAQQKATALIEGLRKDEAELRRGAPALTVERLREGLIDHSAAIDAVAATLDNLDRASSERAGS
jgi:hypothetical protein